MQWAVGIMGYGDVCAGVVPDDKWDVGHKCSGIGGEAQRCACWRDTGGVSAEGRPEWSNSWSGALQMQCVTGTEGCEVGRGMRVQ